MFWMVNKDMLSLMHVDANKHTTTLCVPKFEDLNEVIMKETLEDITELIKCSLNDYLCAECIA